MKLVLGCVRRADQDFGLLQPGDHVGIGVSGGKDSLLLLYALARYRLFSRCDYSLEAFTLTPGLEPFDTSGVAALCAELDIPYTVQETDIAKVIFETRKEKNPCALCAKMRRGVLNELAAAHGCNKLALGHHRDDAIETLLLSLFYEGRLHTFHPNTYLSRCGLTVIRPLIYLPEKHIIHMRNVLKLPEIRNPCPVDGHTKREEVKTLIKQLTKTYHNLPELMLSALQNKAQYGLWDKKRVGDDGLTASEMPDGPEA